ncbi:hypothetical protein GAY31_01205 [Azospirillum brasilense]|nr:hypothetical protein [Azospirillum brasilense]
MSRCAACPWSGTGPPAEDAHAHRRTDGNQKS